MIARSRIWPGLLIAGVLAALFAANAHAQGPPALKRHDAITGDRRPALCRDKEAVALIVAVVAHAASARADQDADRSGRLSEIAARLQNELCLRSQSADTVILRCDLGRRELSSTGVSLMKVTAILQNELSKGEQIFYAWSYQPIEGAGLAADEAASLDRRWCAEEGGSRPIEATPARLIQVQSRLYDFGVRLSNINGQMTGETVQAIIAFQKWADLPATGELTEETYRRINATEPPTPWVVIAFDGSGNYGAVQGGATRRASETDAVRKLQRVSRAEYRLSSMASPGCLGLAMTRYVGRSNNRRITYTQAFTNVGDTLDEARRSVLAYCDQQKGGGVCQVREALCADAGGTVKPRHDDRLPSVNAPSVRFDPKSAPLNAPPPRFDPTELPANAPPPR